MKKIFWLGSLALALAGCGGGDGGSDGIEFKPGSLSFTGNAGQSISSQNVSVNVGLGSGSARYVSVDNKTPGLASVSYKTTHIDAFSMTITPASGLGRGVHVGTVDALVCRDSACSKVDDRGAFTYTITIN